MVFYKAPGKSSLSLFGIPSRSIWSCKAMPALTEALGALDTLSAKDIGEIKAMKNPPGPVPWAPNKTGWCWPSWVCYLELLRRYPLITAQGMIFEWCNLKMLWSNLVDFLWIEALKCFQVGEIFHELIRRWVFFLSVHLWFHACLRWNWSCKRFASWRVSSRTVWRTPNPSSGFPNVVLNCPHLKILRILKDRQQISPWYASYLIMTVVLCSAELNAYSIIQYCDLLLFTSLCKELPLLTGWGGKDGGRFLGTFHQDGGRIRLFAIFANLRQGHRATWKNGCLESRLYSHW